MSTIKEVIGAPGHSPAVKYEVRLAEAVSAMGYAGMTSERVELCFSILDDIIPQLGVFQRVMKMLREELFVAVYSDEYTASAKRKKQTKPSRVPHFIVAKKYMEKQKQQVTKLKEQIEVLKDQLYNCEADLEKASNAVEAYKHDLRDKDTKIQRQLSELQSCMLEKDQLEQVASKQQQVQERLKQDADLRIFALQNTISCLNNENADLRKFKDTHDNVQQALANGRKFIPLEEGKQRATHQASLEYELSVANTLSEQLLVMQNTLIDDYDQFIHSWSEKDGSTRLNRFQDMFKQNMAEVISELSLLESHSATLQSRLSQLESIAETHPHPHQAVIVPAHSASPLVVQEQVMSRYSAMLHTSSDGGTTFYPLKEGEECLSCGSKTVLCPHRVQDKEMVIQLPLNSTHLKIARLPLYVPFSEKKESPAESDRRKSTSQKQVRPFSQGADFSQIWNNVDSRYSNVVRRAPRKLSLEQVQLISLLFYAHELTQDEAISTETHPSLFTSLCDFISMRYLVPSVGVLVLHDFLSSLFDHHDKRNELLLLTHILSGRMDGATFRYFLLLAEVILKVSWTSPQQFSTWLSIVYPFMEEEAMEQLYINYISFCGNKISANTVANYLTQLLIKHKEPLVLQMEAKLEDQQSMFTGKMIETEFAEVCLSLSPSSDLLSQHLFSQSLAQLIEDGRQDKTVPNRQLAYILAYINLHSSISLVLTKLEATEVLQSHSLPGVQQPSEGRGSTEGVVSMSLVKDLALRNFT